MITVLKWLSYLTMAYLYLQIYNQQTNHIKTYFDRQHHYSSQDQKLFREGLQNIILTEPEEEVVIRKYGKLEQDIKPQKDCAIGVGYTTCVDINFKAVNLFSSLKDEFDILKKEGPILPKVHLKITNLREFAETFIYYFSQGANAERVSDSKELFHGFLDTINEKIYHVDEIGGHSSVFALRAQIEGCKVFLTAQPTDFNLKNLKQSPGQAQKYMVWPYEEILEELNETQRKKQHKHYDNHLVFEYNEGDEILGYRAPRSNRFYFVHDPNGSRFQQMEIYHNKVKKHGEFQRHMFGGYQLMQKLSLADAKDRLQTQTQLWQKMRAEPKTDHRIHVEFAHFSNIEFFELFEKFAVRNADSLGMNEQELTMILDYWTNKLRDINEARESKPTLNEMLKQLKLFFQIVKEKKLSLSRVHVHPYGSFLMCYDKNKWEDGRDAIIKSALATPKYCVMSENLADQLENFDVPELPKSFIHPNKPNEKIEVDKQNLTYEFDLTDNIYCYLQFFLKCRSMVKTAGMGDTISSTGFIYQVPKKSYK